MFLEAISALSLPIVNQGVPFSNLSISASSGLVSLKRQKNVFVVNASNNNAVTSVPLTGVVFEPFEEVQKDELLVPIAPQVSLARQRFSEECEAALSDQINVEYSVSYVYHALYAYFNRDNIALKGLAKFFKELSLEERDHSEKLMEYQNKRGGRVNLNRIETPPSEYEHPENGDGLYAPRLWQGFF